MTSPLLNALGIRVIEIPDLGVDGYYAEELRVLFVTEGLGRERREAVDRQVIPWAFAPLADQSSYRHPG